MVIALTLSPFILSKLRANSPSILAVPCRNRTGLSILFIVLFNTKEIVVDPSVFSIKLTVPLISDKSVFKTNSVWFDL